MIGYNRDDGMPSEGRRVVDPVTQEELLVPNAISDVRAIEHARRERAGELHRIRFFLDWGHGYPLWEDGTHKYTMAASDYGISDALGRSLHDWYLYWELHFDPFDGWDSATNRQEWLTTGDSLVRRLTVEVYDIATVVPLFRTYE
jgi:hypothetical protein